MSAVVASPTLGVEVLDPVRALQHALYRAAKADPGRRFHALYDKVHRRDVLARAWWLVRREMRPPKKARAIRSRPNSSVPIQCAHEGGVAPVARAASA